MTSKRQVYKCRVCGIVVEVLEGGAGEPVCCGEPMTLQSAKTEGPGVEIHRPVVRSTDGGLSVTVGDEVHPSNEKHHIQWIEASDGGWTYRRDLAPGDPPTATFPGVGRGAEVRLLCTLHGLWKG